MLSQQVFPDTAYGCPCGKAFKNQLDVVLGIKTDDEGQHCVDKKQTAQL